MHAAWHRRAQRGGLDARRVAGHGPGSVTIIKGSKTTGSPSGTTVSGASSPRPYASGTTIVIGTARRTPKSISSEFIEVGSLRVHHSHGGHGSPVVFIHGLGSSGYMEWRYNLEAAALRHRVFAPDLPGYGRTEKPRARYTHPVLRALHRALHGGAGPALRGRGRGLARRADRARARARTAAHGAQARAGQRARAGPAKGADGSDDLRPGDPAARRRGRDEVCARCAALGAPEHDPPGRRPICRRQRGSE